MAGSCGSGGWRSSCCRLTVRLAAPAFGAGPRRGGVYPGSGALADGEPYFWLRHARSSSQPPAKMNGRTMIVLAMTEPIAKPVRTNVNASGARRPMRTVTKIAAEKTSKRMSENA